LEKEMETRLIQLKQRVVLLDFYKKRPVGQGRVEAVTYADPMRYGVTLDGKQFPEPDVTAGELRAIDE